MTIDGFMKDRRSTDTERLTGVLARIRFASDDGQFSVCELEVEDRALPVTVVGNILSTRVGESVEVVGSWKVDPRYGRQFSIASIQTVLPATADGIEKYLSSGLMEGIGPTLARRIVEHFGEKTLEIIDHRPARIREVEGIGKKRAAQIIESWEEGRLIHGIMVFLRSHGVSAALSVKIYRTFGSAAVDIIRRNPFRLVEEIRGVGFQTADQIARHVGIDEDSPERLRAGVLHVLRSAHDDGHVFLPRSQVEEKARELLGPKVGSLDDIFHSLRQDHRIVVEDEAVYSIPAHTAEVGAADHLRRLLGGAGTLDLLPGRDVKGELAEIESGLGMELASAQRQAILSVFEHPLAVVTGGPGTGKTTIVQAICKLGDKLDRRVALAAPTGRAARRLSEATGRPGVTIHRLLEFSFQAGGFQFDESRPLDVDILVIDEASMIDVYLLYSLARAMPSGASLILVGDIDQLPSVGPGQVLSDLIDSQVASVVYLTEIFRQAEASTIVVNAHRINSGKMPITPMRKEDQLVDFYTINASDPELARQRIVELATSRIPEAFGFDPHLDIQILSPMYRGAVGCDELNQVLQNIFCGDQPHLKRGKRSYHLGDRVMQTTNNYDEDVFNGDIGRVIKVDKKSNELVVDFDGREVTYTATDLDQLTLAYAITVHKSQGSEYPVVIIPVTTQHFVMLQRNLLYTAVTRGRELVILVGTERAVEIAVGNARASARYSRLNERLRRG